MDHVRALDWSKAHFTLETGYAGQYLYSGESCIVVVTLVPPRVDGPPWHIHPSDQSYVILEGTLTVQLGDDEVVAPSGSAVFIPAGLPHQNRNAGDVEEVHFEVIAPGVIPSRPSAAPAPETATGSRNVPGLHYFVADGRQTNNDGSGVVEHLLVDRARGALHAGISMVEVPAKTDLSPLHVHHSDRLYFVDSGILSVQIGINTFHVPRHHLVVIPAMVPHRAWNQQDVIERHVSVVIPEPDPASGDLPGKVDVTLSEIA